METLLEVYAFLIANQVVLVGFLFALSEVLALIPGVKSNSVFQLLVVAIKKFAPKKEVQ
jgi:hypothetical protein